MPVNATRSWGNYTFELICPLSPEIDDAGAIRTFMPQAQYENLRGLRLNPYGQGPFCRFHIPTNLPYEGVYVLTLSDNPVYVGECESLSSRYNSGYGNISPRNCYEGGQNTNCRLNNLIYTTAIAAKSTDLWFLRTAERKTIEAELIGILQPPWNQKGISQR